MTGAEIQDKLINGNLFSAVCAIDQSHPCIIVWSSGAAEQLEAIFQEATSKPESGEPARSAE